MSEEKIAGDGTAAAMALLQKSNPDKIAWGKYFAVQHAKKNLTVHSRDVWRKMEETKRVSKDEKAFWLGAVFQQLRDEKILEKTGEQYKYSDEERGIHERTIPLWRLIRSDAYKAYDKPPSK